MARGTAARKFQLGLLIFSFVDRLILDFNVLVNQAEGQTRLMVELSQTFETIARNRDALLQTFCQDLIELVRVEGAGYVDRHIFAERGSYADFVYAKIRRDWEAGRLDVSDSVEDDGEGSDDDLPRGVLAPDPQRAVYAPTAALASDIAAPAFVKRRRAIDATPENAEAGPSHLPAASPSKASPEKQKRAADPSTPSSSKRVKPPVPSLPEAGPSRPHCPRKKKTSGFLDDSSSPSETGGASPLV